MNGWQRLFLVIVVGTCAVFAAVTVAQRPSPDDSHFIIKCRLVDSYVTPERAKKYLSEQRIPEEDFQSWAHDNTAEDWKECSTELKEVASGAEYREAQARWKESTQWAIAGIAIFFAVLYALGAALGWVWRGFFPRKPQRVDVFLPDIRIGTFTVENGVVQLSASDARAIATWTSGEAGNSPG